MKIGGRSFAATVMLCALPAIIAPARAAAGGQIAMEWARTFIHPEGGEDYCVASHTDAEGKTRLFIANDAFAGGTLCLVRTFDSSGNFLNDLPLVLAGSTVPVVYGAAVDASGSIYVCAYTNGEYGISKYSPQGAFLWDQREVEISNFGYHNGMVADEAGVWMAFTAWDPVSEGPAANLLKLSDSGAVEWDYKAEFKSFSSGLAADGSGALYFVALDVADWHAVLFKFDAAGNPVLTRDIGSVSGWNSFMGYHASRDSLYVAFKIASYEFAVLELDPVTGSQRASYFSDMADLGRRLYELGGLSVDGADSIYITASAYPASNTSQFDISVFRIDASLATMQWARFYNSGYKDYPCGINLDLSGNAYVGGTAKDYLQLPSSDCPVYGDPPNAWLGKYSGAGTLIWAREYDAASETSVYDIEGMPDGGILAGGQAGVDYETGARVMLRRYDRHGSLLWEKLLGNPYYCDLGEIWDMAVSGDQVYLPVIGTNGIDQDENDDALIFRTDLAGEARETIVYDFPYDRAAKALIELDNSGNIILAINVYDSEETKYDLHLAKLWPDGTVAWSKDFPILGDDTLKGLALDEDGNIIVLLRRYSILPNSYILAKYDSSGEPVWERTYTSSLPYTSGTDIVAGGGAIYFCGYEKADGSTLYEGSVGKVDYSGNLLWKRNLRERDVIFCALDADTAGNIFVAGYNDEGVLVASYDALGALQWEQLYDEGGIWEYPNDISAEPVYVGGASGSSGLLIKYGESTISDQSYMPMKLFPNPVSGDQVSVVLPLQDEAREVTIWIFNVVYEQVYKGVWLNVSRGNATITIDRMLTRAPGRYLVKARAVLASGEIKDFPVLKMVVKR